MHARVRRAISRLRASRDLQDLCNLTAIELRRIRNDDGVNRSNRAGRNGREDVVTRSVREQVVDDVRSCIPEDARPSDDVEVVTVASANRIGAMLDQQPYGVEIVPLAAG